MEKLIIVNQTDQPMENILRLAEHVIKMGRIKNNNNQYCGLISVVIDNEEYHTVSNINKNSGKLTFYKASKPIINFESKP